MEKVKWKMENGKRKNKVGVYYRLITYSYSLNISTFGMFNRCRGCRLD